MMKPLHITMTKNEQLWGLLYLLCSVLLLPVLIPYCMELLFPGSSAAVKNFVFFLVNFLAVAGIFRRFLKKTLDKLSLAWKASVGYAALGLLAYFAASFALSLVYARFFPEFSNINDQNILALSRENFTLMAIGAVFLVPVYEECLYRGLVFGGLLQKSPVAAYLLSAIVFSLIHVIRYIPAAEPLTLLLCALQYLPAGIFLGWAYHKSGSLFCPVLIHAVINALGIFL